MSDDLACPFCGSTPQARETHGRYGNNLWFGCENEDCEIGPFLETDPVDGPSSFDALREIWNRRIPASISNADLSDLKSKVDEIYDALNRHNPNTGVGPAGPPCAPAAGKPPEDL